MLIIKWQKELSWTIKVSWSKNASLPIFWASLLVKWKIKLNNVPKIWDVNTFLDILSWIWVKYNWEWNTLYLDTNNINNENLNFEKIKKIRSSIFLLSPMLYHFWKLKIPFPWWCSIWKRPIDQHLNWLEKIWYKTKFEWDDIVINWKLVSWKKILNAGFSVSSTENLLVANVLRWWETIIKNVANEPHVMNLIDFLRQVWADIKIRYNHTIIINWVDSLKSEIEFDIISDYIESWTYMIIWALISKEYIDIENARIDDLYTFIEKLKETWVKTKKIWEDTLRVYRAKDLRSISIQTNIFPAFPTDLQSPFAILMTQAKWMSKIHEVLFESRLNFLVELEKMKCNNIAIMNPHEALIFWPNKLKWWSTVTSWDLRAWVAMVIAALIANWETRITNIEYIYRWYENFVEKLKCLWADINEAQMKIV